jgi:FkbM family methyltransferase
MIEDNLVLYRPPRPIAGVRPYFILTEDQVDYFDSCGGAPEAELIDWALTELLPSGGRFLDIGAHIGTWSMTAALIGATVHAFEPQRRLFARLKAASELNDSHADLSRIAVTSGPDRLMTLKSPYRDGGGGSTVVDHKTVAFQEAVHGRSLDGFFYPRKYPFALMKIDVEGAEFDVLQGAEASILDYQPKILFECWEDERGQRKEELFKYINDVLQYKVTKVSWPEMWLAEPK